MCIMIIILALVGLTFLYLAYSVGRGNIGLIHDYHTKKIKEENLKPYAKTMSKGLAVMGLGILLSAIFLYFEIMTGFGLAIFISLIMGILIFNKAQKKYNGGWFA